MSDERQKSSDSDGSLIGTAAAVGAGSLFGLFFSPFKSKLFLLALIATLAGGYFIVKQSQDSTAEVPGWAPWAMRIGISFVAAFVFAYLVRRAIKWAIIIGGALIAGAFFLNKLGFGITQDQIEQLKEQVNDSEAVIKQTADSAWTAIKPHLPSSGAAGAGLWRGVRHQQPKS